MKRFLVTVLTIIIIVAALFAIAYALDNARMSEGKEVLFSTWGNDYVPLSEKEAVSSDAVSEEIPQNAEKSEIKAVLYFADSNIMHLCAEERTIDISEGAELSVARAVIEGPKSDNLTSLIPADTVINSIETDDFGTCIIDLNDEFINFTSGTSMETLSLMSLVNSLCALDSVEEVKINIEGNESAFFGHYSLEEAYKSDMTLVK